MTFMRLVLHVFPAKDSQMTYVAEHSQMTDIVCIETLTSSQTGVNLGCM